MTNLDLDRTGKIVQLPSARVERHTYRWRVPWWVRWAREVLQEQFMVLMFGLWTALMLYTGVVLERFFLQW